MIFNLKKAFTITQQLTPSIYEKKERIKNTIPRRIYQDNEDDFLF